MKPDFSFFNFFFYSMQKEILQREDFRGEKMTGQPEKKFNVGLVKATVWKNTSSNGEFRSVSLTKSYKKDGEWKNGNSFGVADIDKAIQALEEARDYLANPESGDEIVA